MTIAQKEILLKVSQWLGRVAFGLSTVLVLAVTSCYIIRADAVAVITLPPFWAWAVPGLLLGAVAWRTLEGSAPRVLFVTWIALTLFLSDDILCLLLSPVRAGSRAAHKETSTPLRIVTLNCASQAKAVEEIAVWKPDIVLLQESPASNDVVRLCQEWFGAQGNYLYGLDCSILCRGQLKPIYSPRSLRFNWARVTLPTGMDLDVVSLRLFPPDTRFDLWSPDCWRQHTHGRQLRRTQLQELMTALEPVLGHRLMIIGGDFNAPAGDAIFKLCKGSLKDCFREAGRGWGNTAINTVPISRPDQVWISKSGKTLRAQAKETEHSDHRMVICDVEFR